MGVNLMVTDVSNENFVALWYKLHWLGNKETRHVPDKGKGN